MQSIGITAGFNTLAGAQLLKTALTPQVFIMIGIILTAGSMIVTWLGEQIQIRIRKWCFYDYLCRDCCLNSRDDSGCIYVDYFVNVPSSRINSSIISVIILIITGIVDHLFYNLCSTSRIQKFQSNILKVAQR